MYALVDKPSHVLCSFLKLHPTKKIQKYKIKETSTKQFKLNSNLQTFLNEKEISLFFAGTLIL